VASSYKITIRCTGSDYEEKISFLGLKTVRSGSTMEIQVEADDEDSAKRIISNAVGSSKNLFLGAKKV
jgi:hypothetical protein